MPDQILEEQILQNNILAYQVFQTDAGKRVLDDLRNFCYYDETTFRDGDSSETVLYREGRRSVIVWIMALLENPETAYQEIKNGHRTSR